MDVLLLKIIKTRTQYDLLIPGLPHDILDKDTQIVVRAFGEWFSKYTDKEVIDISDFKTFFFNFHKSGLDEDRRNYFNEHLNRCKANPSTKEISSIASKLVELTLATKVGNLAAQYHEGAEIEIVPSIGQEYEQAMLKLDQETEGFHVTSAIGELLQDDQDNTGLQFDLTILRNNLRPLRKRDFVIVAGRPDTGKTSFLASQLKTLIRGMEDGRPVVWFNNEGDGGRIVKRIYQAILNRSTDDLLSSHHEGTLQSDFATAMGGDPDRVKVVDCHGWNSGKIEKAIRHYKPGLVIFDMIDNIEFPSTRDKVRTDQILEGMYQWARILGVKYDFPVIATSQISAEAEQATETQCWPAMHMLKDSKTGKQGAADVIIMIGKSADPMMESSRYISTPKNKLARSTSSVRQEVRFDPIRSQYKDPLN